MIRRVGEGLGLSQEIVQAPFPGPGLAIRIAVMSQRKK